MRVKVFADACRSQHPAVADQDHFLQAKTEPQFVDLRGDGLGIARIALEDFHCDGATFRGSQQSAGHLYITTVLIARMAKAGQRAVTAFEIGGTEVIEDQRNRLTSGAWREHFRMQIWIRRVSSQSRAL